MDVEAIRRELRHGESDSLRRRRWISLLSAVGAVDFAIISLYQMGIIRHLPDPPGAIFDSDKVNASRTAYALGVPDGPLGLGLYALTLILAGAGGDDRRRRHPVFDLLVGGAVAAGVVGAAHYVYDMIRHQQRACPYCLVGAATHVAMLPSAVANATAAIRRLRGRAPAA
jgi:uncharacterized membrane protein